MERKGREWNVGCCFSCRMISKKGWEISTTLRVWKPEDANYYTVWIKTSSNYRWPYSCLVFIFLLWELAMLLSRIRYAPSVKDSKWLWRITPWFVIPRLPRGKDASLHMLAVTCRPTFGHSETDTWYGHTSRMEALTTVYILSKKMLSFEKY